MDVVKRERNHVDHDTMFFGDTIRALHCSLLILVVFPPRLNDLVWLTLLSYQWRGLILFGLVFLFIFSCLGYVSVL